MRIRFLQVVGLLSALCCLSFWGNATFAQDKPATPPRSGSYPSSRAIKQAKPEPRGPVVDRSVDTRDVLLQEQRFSVADQRDQPFLQDRRYENEAARETDPQGSGSVSTRMTQKVRASLEKFGDFQYVEVPFVEVQADLEKQFGSNVVLDQTAIDDALTEEELVTTNLKNVRYCDGLRILLRDYNATYVIQNGIIRVISLANVDDPEMHTRIMLDVQPTLDLIKKYDGRMDSAKYKELEDSESSMLILTHAISLVAKSDNSCTDIGGHATLEIAGGILIVRGPELMLSEVKDFVEDLHAQLEARSH